LESPAGVGFSFSKTNSDYTTGDYQTAYDSVVFLQKWLTMYPQFQENEFWIAGESYGGHYVPELAAAILYANSNGGSPTINLQGFQVGNAWTDAPVDNQGAVFDWWTHAMISDQTFHAIMASCNFSVIGPLSADSESEATLLPNDACDDSVNQANTDMAVINIYDIYADVCLNSSGITHQGEQLIHSLSHSGARTPYTRDFLQRQRRAHRAKHAKGNGSVGDQMPDPDPCVSIHLQEYMNIPAVQQALHAQPTAWLGCSEILNYSYQDLLTSVIPVYQMLLTNANLRILVYSGDVDGIVPITGTRAWMATFGFSIDAAWRPWIDSGLQTGGYTVHYGYSGSKNGLTFASVRDAGHMVPWTQPGRSFDLFSRFLLNQPL